MGRVDELIRILGLQPHPERGWYARSYRAGLQLTGLHGLTDRAPRPASTAIYFLLGGEQRATYLHRLKSDELFHLYEGGPLEVLMLAPDGIGQVRRLGMDLEAGDRPQLVIPAGTWFGAELVAGASHCLWGCTVSPGFDFADFELADGADLARRHPDFTERIARMNPPDTPSR